MSPSQHEQALRKQGAAAERRRLQTRFNTLQDAVEKLKTQLHHSAAHVAGLKGIITREREEATALRVKSDADDAKLENWMRFAYVGQKNALKHGRKVDAAASFVKREHLRVACDYWEARALQGCPPPSMAVAAKDESIRHYCTHMDYPELYAAMASEKTLDEVAPSVTRLWSPSSP
tara:strand:- start:4 stop:531 length:528 start_codon:yes stop_codon:yes gene_type:complete